MSDITEKQEIDKLLRELPSRIEKTQTLLLTYRGAYNEAKAAYKLKLAKVKLETKINNPDATQTDVDSEAIVQSEVERLAMVAKESEYRKAQKDLERIKNDFDSVKERAANYRTEIKRFQG